jgi:diketogulonate reductase-like aldo/keto reductase
MLHMGVGMVVKMRGRRLVEAQEEGKIRSPGISNYGVHHLDEVEIYMKELEEERRMESPL